MVKQNKTVTAKPDELIKTLTTLKKDFEFPLGVTAVHTPPNFQIIYKLISLGHPYIATVNVKISDNNATLPSATDLFPGYKAHELEIYDLMGIEFTGTSNERIFLPEDFQGHPLRKDYK